MAQGRQIFLNETFAGNGRSCGTCHVETNNFTVDPQLIATLPATDPLFVAETNPALATLENPDLLRRFGLILVNADGFDPPAGGPAVRAPRHAERTGTGQFVRCAGRQHRLHRQRTNPNPSERLGWGNDGAPLRDFALVAIAQHAPKTLHRVRGVDFRVPTDEELDALAAYQLAVGRQEDFDLPALTLKSALASSGKALYLDTGNLGETGRKNCNACHFNGGGTAAMSFNPLTPGFPDLDGSPRGFNMTAETNVERHPAGPVPRPSARRRFRADVRPCSDRSAIRMTFPLCGHLELEGFNSPPVVESADTGPFFHNHTVTDLESSVAFYGTPAFQTSIFGTPPVIPVTISPDPTIPRSRPSRRS